MRLLASLSWSRQSTRHKIFLPSCFPATNQYHPPRSPARPGWAGCRRPCLNSSTLKPYWRQGNYVREWESPIMRTSSTVVLVDDDRNILNSLRMALEAEGYKLSLIHI